MNISEQLTQIATKEAENIELNGQLREIVAPESRNLCDPIFTGNLFVDTAAGSVIKAVSGYSQAIPCLPNTTYTVSGDMTGMNSDDVRIGFTSEYPAVGVVTVARRLNTTDETPTLTFTTSDECRYILLMTGTSSVNEYPNLMLNEGSEALPFEPYKPKNTMSLSEGINQLNSDVQNIKMSIEDKGVEVLDSTSLCDYPEKVDEVYAAGQSSMVDESKIIEKTVSGEYISLDDVSEIPHEVKVRLTSGGNNKLPYPYVDTTKTVNGITFTDNGDGTITANGISTDLADFILQENFLIQEGMYITGIDGSNSLTYEIQAYTNQQNIITTNPNGNPQCKADFTASTVRVRIRSGVTLNNLVFKPMLSFTPNIPYEPYKETLTDYSGVSLTRCGGNIATVNNFSVGQLKKITFALPIPANTPFTISGNFSTNSGKNMLCRFISANNTELRSIYITSSGTTQTFDKECTHIYLYAATSAVESVGYTLTVADLMVNIGSTPLSYEPFKGQTLTANADGTVEGVKSTSPYMYMTTDNPNVTINATYHKSYGMQTEYDRFWDVFQDYGNRTEYPSAFQGVYWKDEIFKPKYLLQPTKAGSMFIRTGITDIRMVDLTKATDVGNLCNSSTQGIRYVGKIGNSSITTFGSVFGWCHKLISVEKMIVGANAQFATAFEGCYDLESITFEGTIAYNISFAGSSKLNKESLISIISHLKDHTGTSNEFARTLTLSSASKTLLDENSVTINNINWQDYMMSIGWNYA